jgi:hypothetical protein
MPDGIPPLLETDHGDDAAALERIARAIYSNRTGIRPSDLDNWFDVNPSELDELDRIIDDLAHDPLLDSVDWADGRPFFVDVTPSPEGEMVQRGQRFAVVRSYTYEPVPNRKRRTIAPWAFFGQR